ncbi:MAG: YbaK/EbsC family protein [Acidobacteria bacterium]|nr:YbaK/EbsC family protein [Acidobacteriota bacterium]
MPSKLKDFLDQKQVSYLALVHPRAYTAQEVAAALHVPGQELAKTVVVQADGRFVLTVLPASYRLNFEKLRATLGAKDVRLATEGEFGKLFPECELGGMAPFGNLYNLPVWVDTSLTRDEEILFNAGTHIDTIKMKYVEFDKLVQPRVSTFADHL